VYDTVRQGVLKKVSKGSFIARNLFRLAYRIKSAYVSRGGSTPLLDAIVFKKTKQALGGRMRLMVSGGGALSSETQQFMNICFCCPIGQGYGLTETCAASTVVDILNALPGEAGYPVPCNDVKLVDWEEGGYFASQGKGEVCISGANVTAGYYKEPEKTAEAFRMENGRLWFHTGDIGQWTPHGTLKIIDRKKDLLKLSHGEYVSLAALENTLRHTKYAVNLMAYTKQGGEYMVAVVEPDADALAELGSQVGATGSLKEVAASKAVQDTVLKDLQRLCKEAGHHRTWAPQKVHIATDLAWEPNTGLVTAAMKLRRPNLVKHYKEQLDAMM
jgi:long-chain acyl-CoA synthetase